MHHVDKVVLVDGKFSYYPGNSPISTDGTIETIRHFKEMYPDKIVFVEGKGYPDEPAKRNVYLEMVPEDDWLWIIDGDELPFGMLNRVKPYLKARAKEPEIVRSIYFRHVFLHRPLFIHMRFIRKKEGMKYSGTHFTIQYEGRNILDYELWKHMKPLPVWLIHYGELRNGGKTIKKDDFREKLEEVEGVFTEEAFPGKFYCIIPECEVGGNEMRLAARGIAYNVSMCGKHKKEYLQRPMIELLKKHGSSERNMKLRTEHVHS